MASFTKEEQNAITERENANRYWDELREVYRKISQGLSRNNNRSGERAIWELMQNAGDLCKEGEAAVVKLQLANNNLCFTHRGIAFTQKTLEDLIRQRSSKDGQTKVGRFGTGFMTTHVFNKKVYISGSCLVEYNGKRLYLPFKDFCLNRDFDEMESFIKEADNALKAQKDILSADGTEIDVYPTIFRYPLSNEKLEAISIQLEKTAYLMPYVLTFNDTIKECQIENQYANKKVQYVKINEVQTPCLYNNNVLLCETTIKVCCNEDEKDVVVRTLRNIDGTDRIVIAPLPVGYDDVNSIPSQFLFFPMLGSENFGSNFIFHSSRLTPTEPRDSYELPKDNDNFTRVYKDNEQVLTEMFDMLFEYYRSNIEEQSLLSKDMASVEFHEVAPKRAKDDVEKEYYEKLQLQFSNEMASFSMIPYSLSEDKSSQFTSIKSGIVKVFDPQIYSNLTEEQIKKYLPTIITYAQKVATLPCEDVLGWSKVVASWDTTRPSWFVTLDQICGGIKDNSADLHTFLMLLKDMGQLGVDLMKKYPLIPNREGVLCKLDALRVGKSINSDLYAIARPILRENADILVDSAFEDVCDRAEYTRTDLRDNLGSAIDCLKKSTLEYMTGYYNHIRSPRLLNELSNTTTIADLVMYCSSFPTEHPDSFRYELMPIISEFYGIEFTPTYIPNEKTDTGKSPIDIYTRVFNYLVEHTMFMISTIDKEWLTTNENHESNHDLLLQFVSSYAKSAASNNEHMERLKKYAIFPNQLGEMRMITDEDFYKNIKIESDFVELYQDVMGEDLRSKWVDDDFRDLISFREHEPKSVGKKMEDEVLRQYLEEKRRNGAEFTVNNAYESALLKIVNHLEKGMWSQYFDFFAIETNLRNVSYELGTPEQKDALYRIKLNSDQNTLNRLADVAQMENPLELLEAGQEYLRNKEADEYIKKLGAIVENSLLDFLASKLKDEGISIRDEQDGQDYILTKDGCEDYRIEVKSRWQTDECVEMSHNQFHRAVDNKERYALVLASMETYPQPNEELNDYFRLNENELRMRVRAIDNIGILEEDLRNRTVEAYRGTDGQDVCLNGSYTVRVPQKLFKAEYNRDHAYNLDDFIARIINYFR